MSEKRRPNKVRGYLWMGLFAAVIAALIFSPKPSRETSPVPAPIPADVAPAPAVKTVISDDEARTRTAAIGAIELRESMRNPDSFQLADVLLMPRGAVCYEYRAQNGFGGMNVGGAVMVGLKLKAEGSEGFDSAMKKYCYGKTGTDVKDRVQSLISK